MFMHFLWICVFSIYPVHVCIHMFVHVYVPMGLPVFLLHVQVCPSDCASIHMCVHVYVPMSLPACILLHVQVCPSDCPSVFSHVCWPDKFLNILSCIFNDNTLSDQTLHLINKFYVNGIILTVSWAETMLIMGSRSFQRCTVGHYRSKGCKAMSYQSWRFDKKSAAWPSEICTWD